MPGPEMSDVMRQEIARHGASQAADLRRLLKAGVLDMDVMSPAQKIAIQKQAEGGESVVTASASDQGVAGDITTQIADAYKQAAAEGLSPQEFLQKTIATVKEFAQAQPPQEAVSRSFSFKDNGKANESTDKGDTPEPGNGPAPGR